MSDSYTNIGRRTSRFPYILAICFDDIKHLGLEESPNHSRNNNFISFSGLLMHSELKLSLHSTCLLALYLSE